MDRQLRDIPGFDGYMASSDGLIWTTKRKGGSVRLAGQRGEPREMAYSANKTGYLRVSLDVAGRVSVQYVHALILLTFVGPRPDGAEGCHYPDPTKTNNAADNLRWDTHRENIRDRTRERIGAAAKKCGKCGDDKPAADFYGDKRAIDGLHGYCKKCHGAVAVSTRDPEKRRVANREYMRRLRSQSKG